MCHRTKAVYGKWSLWRWYYVSKIKLDTQFFIKLASQWLLVVRWRRRGMIKKLLAPPLNRYQLTNIINLSQFPTIFFHNITKVNNIFWTLSLKPTPPFKRGTFIDDVYRWTLGLDDLTVFKCISFIFSFKKVNYPFFVFVYSLFLIKKSPKVVNLPLTEEKLCLTFWRHKQAKWLL